MVTDSERTMLSPSIEILYTYILVLDRHTQSCYAYFWSMYSKMVLSFLLEEMGLHA